MHLPPSAPHSSLSSEPHSFSRVFTGGFFEAMAGMLQVHAPGRAATADDLAHVAKDAAQLLVKGARSAALCAAFYSEVSAQIIWADGLLFNGKSSARPPSLVAAPLPRPLWTRAQRPSLGSSRRLRPS